MEKLYIVIKTRPGADCGSDHELLIAKFRLKLKKVGKTTRPFRYDLNQIPFDYTVEVRSRFKGLDLIDRVSDELWNEVRDIVQEAVIKSISKKIKCIKAKWLSEAALQIAVKRREAKSKGEKERYKHQNGRRQWHPTPVLLPGKSHGQRRLVGCSPWGRYESDTTEQLHFHFSLSCIREGNGNPLQCSCLENPRDGGAWWAAVSGVTQSQTRLSNQH